MNANHDVFLNIHQFNPYAANPGDPYRRGQRNRLEDLLTWKSPTLVLTIIQVLIFTGCLMALNIVGNYTCILYHMGSKYTPAIRYRFEIYRLICPIFLHGGIFHLLANMISQLLIGFNIEKVYGVWKFLYLYFISGLTGNLVSALYFLYGTSVGASSSIFGLMGLQGAYLLKNYDRLNLQFMDRVDKNTILVYCIFLLVNVAFALQPHSGIDIAGHFGGFVAGYLIGSSYLYQNEGKKKQIVALNLLLWTLIVGMFVAIFMIDLIDVRICRS